MQLWSLLSLLPFSLFQYGLLRERPTNTELDIGKTATVIEEINNVSCTGRARLNGVDWNAVSSDDTVIKAGSVVKINDIKGTKLYVSLYIEEKSSVK